MLPKQIIAALLPVVGVMAEPNNCPSPESITPCTCDDTGIRCVSNDEFDLEPIFKKLAETTTQWDKFYLEAPSVTGLSESGFHGIQFTTLEFKNCFQLDCIPSSALAAIKNSLEKFVSHNTSFAGSDASTCNLFGALKSFPNLQSIKVTNSKIKEIPNDAFGNCGSLTSIDFSDGEISNVDEYAFKNLDKLKSLDLQGNRISKLASHAFHFKQPSDNYLTINLESNQLTEESFGSELFGVNQRITTLKLGGNPNIAVLKEPIFKPFLLESGRTSPNEQNIVDMRGSPLACSKSNIWMLENKFKLQRRIIHAISAESGGDFWRHTPSQCDK